MALSISVGPDPSRHLSAAAASPSCRGVGDGGCSGLLAFPALASVSFRKGQGSGRRSPSDSASGTVNSYKSSRSSRGVICGAELKSSRTVEVYDDNLEHKPVFRPPLGWPFSAITASDLHLLGKKMKARVMLHDTSLDLEDEQDEKDEAVSNGLDDRQQARPSETLYRQWIATEFSAAVQSGSPPPKQKQENSERDNYYVNTGYAIRTLREELPNMFYQKMNFDIYREDITFRDPMNVFSGIDNYKLIFWALRFHGRIFFKALWVDIARVWQPHDKVIMVRWTVRGIPRVPWEALGQFDGTSEYKLDKDGKIYEHKVDNVLFNSPPTQKYKAISVMDLVRVAGGHTNPTPSFYAQAAGAVVMLFPYLQTFTWVRFYWALTSTIALFNVRECRHELRLDT